MQTKEYRTIDKSTWGAGPWQDEPDKMQWQDETAGLPCLIVRNQVGALCGYAGVPESHPWHGKGYGDAVGECTEECEPENNCHYYEHRIDGRISVHGGLTFADRCAPDAGETRHICHVPDPGEPDHVWWFGFGCAHYRDFSPEYEARMPGMGFSGDYKDVHYVKDEIAGLAAQLAQVARSAEKLTSQGSAS